MNTSAKATVVLLLAAASVALSAMIHGAGKFEWNGFYPWVIGPYVVLMLVFCLPLRQSRPRSIAGCVAACLVLVFTRLLYIEAMWFSASSTSALIFIFAPVYFFVGGFIAWGIAWIYLARRTAEMADRG
jgi:hypothetical protein